MAVTSARFLDKNCTRLTRFNFVNASSFVNTYTLRYKYIEARSRNFIFALETRPNGHNFFRGVVDRPHAVLCGNDLVLRYTSTDASSPAGGESRIQKFRKVLYDFYQGGKQLFQDVKLTWKIRRKLRSNNWNYDVLERKELWTMLKTKKNLKKTLPIVALSCLPVIGYLGPVIGFLRPRQFLSNHFWTAKQKEKFILLDNQERAVCRNSIFQIIREETKRVENEGGQLLYKITARDDVSSDSSLEKSFLVFSSGIFALENLQRIHLQRLCSFWILRTWWPSFMLKRNLRKEMIVIHKDDVAIAREGVETLNEKQLKEACHVRGLDTLNISSKALQTWLQSWLDLTRDISEKETSFLAHLAVFKAVNVQETLKDVSTK